MFAYSKRKGIMVSIIMTILIGGAFYFIQMQLQSNQKKEEDATFILKTSQIDNITTSLVKKEEIEREERIQNQYQSNPWRR